MTALPNRWVIASMTRIYSHLECRGPGLQTQCPALTIHAASSSLTSLLAIHLSVYAFVLDSWSTLHFAVHGACRWPGSNVHLFRLRPSCIGNLQDSAVRVAARGFIAGAH